MRKVQGERPCTRPTKQRPVRQVQLQQEVDRVAAGVGLQENRGIFQGLRRVLQMMVWGLGQERRR